MLLAGRLPSGTVLVWSLLVPDTHQRKQDLLRSSQWLVQSVRDSDRLTCCEPMVSAPGTLSTSGMLIVLSLHNR